MPISADSSPRFHGIIPPLVTPLRGEEELDEQGLSRLLEHVIGGGVSGVFILGTTGEGPSLSYRLRRELTTLTCELVDGRVPVLVGISDTSRSESIDLALVAADAGASAVVLAAPYYMPLTQDELIAHVTCVADQVGLPLLLYNIPQLTKTPLKLESVERLCEIDSIIGIKDSSGELNYFAQLTRLRARRPDWSFLMGPERLLVESLRRGGTGGVHGGANVLPALFVQCYRAQQNGEHDQAAQLSRLIDRYQAVYGTGDDTTRPLMATKSALAALGICRDVSAPPLAPLKPEQHERIRAVLEDCLADVGAPA